MAYAAVITITNPGAGEFEVLIEETDCGAADVATVDGVPASGNVIRVSSEVAGTTINPILTRTTPPGSANITDVVVQPVQTAAAIVDVSASAPYAVVEFDSTGKGRLYHSARCTAGSNNTVSTLYRITQNW